MYLLSLIQVSIKSLLLLLLLLFAVYKVCEVFYTSDLKVKGP